VTKKAKDRLEAEYRQRVWEIRADSSLSWEKKELKVRDLGEEEEYDRENRRSQQAEEAA
jgi:hypothetical protein